MRFISRVIIWFLVISVGLTVAYRFVPVPVTLTMLFDEGGLDRLWTLLEQEYRDRPGCRLHYVSAWEMAERIRRIATGDLLDS